MRIKIHTLMVLFFFCSGEVQATLSNTTQINRIQTHINFFSSDALEGRLTGSRGEKIATQYIANQFHLLGLEPAGENGTFFQEFNFTAGVLLGKHNIVSISDKKGMTKHLVLNKDWRPLAFSSNTSFENTELVFAGYGITAPASGKLPSYDSYQHLNVKDKWVVVFRFVPEKVSDERDHQLSQYSSLLYKTFTAKSHGAKGIIFVNGPNSNVDNDLIPLSFDTSLSHSGIVALSVKNTVINDILNNNGHQVHSLKKIQDALDSGQPHSLPMLNGIKITGQTDIKKNIQRGRNVLAKLRMTQHATQMIVVGAHIDHLGHGELGSSRARDDEEGMIHSGADDNASGVASVLETATKLCDLKTQDKLHGNKDILLAAWSGEEFGTLGSSYFVQHFMKSHANKSLHPNIDAAINLDMVGHLRKKLVIQGTGSSIHWSNILGRIRSKHPFAIIMQSDPYLPTDSTSFYLQGVPTLNFFTGAQDNYHTPRDKPDTLNYDGIKSISAFLVDLVQAVEEKPSPINYRKVNMNSDHSERQFNIYLGTIPDYTSSDMTGIKLSGVAKNSPAEQAGIRHGDVIIKLAGKNIHDIYDYTFVLNSLHAGARVKLILLRGKKKVALTITPRYRE